MSLRFLDRKGHYGVVTESLEVKYSGQWKQEVAEVVSQVREDTPDDELTELIIELSENAPLSEVSRADVNQKTGQES